MLLIEKNRRGHLAACLFLMAIMISACSSSNSQSTFNPDTGSHAAGWPSPFAIGSDDFHATAVKKIQSASPGAVLFGLRCALCHGNDGAGKIAIAPTIQGKNAADITNAISVIPPNTFSVVPLMTGQAGLAPAEIQAIAGYLATLPGGAAPAVISADLCIGCHGRDLRGGIARISCFVCHDALDTSPDQLNGEFGHPLEWAEPAADPVLFHGSYGRKFRLACTVCHGVNFEGGAIGQACSNCHRVGGIAPVLDFISPPGFVEGITITTPLEGAQEVPPVATGGSGTATLTVNAATGAISGNVTFTGLTSNATAAHIHQAPAGTNGPIAVPLIGGAGATEGTWRVPSGTILTAAQLEALRAGQLYVNIHTLTNPGGEIRGQIIFPGP